MTQRIEEQLTMAVAQLFTLILPASVRWTHLPFGEFRKPKTADRLKKMGTKSGWSDFQLLHAGNAYFIELKKPKDAVSGAGRLSANQLDFQTWLSQNGFCFAVCYSTDDVLAVLKRWGIPTSKLPPWVSALPKMHPNAPRSIMLDGYITEGGAE